MEEGNCMSLKQNDQFYEAIMDMTTSDELSSCCNAPIIAYTFCSDCMENCK